MLQRINLSCLFFLLPILWILLRPMPGHTKDVTLSWNDSYGATGYKVFYENYTRLSGPPYRGDEAVEGVSPIDVGNTTRFTFHNLPDNGYRFSVKAYNHYGESDYSDEAVLPPSNDSSDTSTPDTASSYLGSLFNSWAENVTAALAEIFDKSESDLSTQQASTGEKGVISDTQVSPVINSFGITPETVGEGETAILIWDVSQAQSAAITPDIGAVCPTRGSVEIRPSGSSVYTLTAMNAYGSDTATVTPKIGPRIVEVIPRDGAGIQDDERICHDTSFAARIVDPVGIDLTDPQSISFTISDGTRTYERNLGDTDVVRITKLLDEKDSYVTECWAVYHRALEPELGNYPFGQEIRVEVSIQTLRKDRMIQIAYEFGIESLSAHNFARFYAPVTCVLAPGDMTAEGYDAGIRITAGELAGAEFAYDNNVSEDLRFGPTDEIPKPDIQGATAVGTPLNLQPHTVFETPAALFIPCPDDSDVSELTIYRFDGKQWHPACDANGNVLPEGEGWIIPGSRINYNTGDPSMIEIRVIHSAAAVAVNEP